MKRHVTQVKKEKRIRRHQRIRARVSGTKDRPRLSVFKSNRALYAQLIDDDLGITLAAAHAKVSAKGRGIARAKTVGEDIAKKAKKHKISRVVFDRGGYMYTGKIKELAEGARKGGLKF
ncbi:50S ribosomal protein L18 [Patescibacteria group bacterium]|nr:50S ribosomal protein L18 [Patescibacteria group bacterium]